jgi:hypothetical protein
VRFDQWFVAYQIGQPGSKERFVPNGGFFRFRKLIPPADRFWADPFAFEHGGRLFIFVEELLYQTELGHIAVFEINRDGIAGSSPALKRDYHLPTRLYSMTGRCSMILKRCDPKSNCSGLQICRMNGRSTAFLSPIFAPLIQLLPRSTASGGCSRASRPCRNPVGQPTFSRRLPDRPEYIPKSGEIRCSKRSAGGTSVPPTGSTIDRLKILAERGHSIVINEIVRISEDEFVERRSQIVPRWADQLLSITHYNADGALTVIDGLLSRRRNATAEDLLGRL